MEPWTGGKLGEEESCKKLRGPGGMLRSVRANGGVGVWGHGGHVCGRIKADRSLRPPLLSSVFPHRGLPLCSTDSAPACPCCLGDAGVQARIRWALAPPNGGNILLAISPKFVFVCKSPTFAEGSSQQMDCIPKRACELIVWSSGCSSWNKSHADRNRNNKNIILRMNNRNSN